MSTELGVYLDIPQADLEFFKKLVKKMGWKMVLSKKEKKIKEGVDDDVLRKLYGCIELPVDFDYKEELQKAIEAKYV